MRSALLSAVSHDLRTPLAAITGAATTCATEARPSTTPEQADLLETICEEAERLDRLVRNLLDMTRLESGALAVQTRMGAAGRNRRLRPHAPRGPAQRSADHDRSSAPIYRWCQSMPSCSSRCS